MTASRQAGEPPARVLASQFPDWFILVLFSVLLHAQTILNIREKSATFDGTLQLPAGFFHHFRTAGPDCYGIAYPHLPGNRRPTIDRALTLFAATSATDLQGLEFLADGRDQKYLAEFLRQQPMAKIGYSIFVCRIDESALSIGGRWGWMNQVVNEREHVER